MDLTRQDIDHLRAAMEEEHRLNMQALERVKRFLVDSRNRPQGTAALEPKPEQGISNNGSADQSILRNIDRIFLENADRTFSARQIIEELGKRDVRLGAKNPIATVSVSLKKLVDRNRIVVVRRGSGREPNIYKAGRHPSAVIEEEELMEQTS